MVCRETFNSSVILGFGRIRFQHGATYVIAVEFGVIHSSQKTQESSLAASSASHSECYNMGVVLAETA